MKLNDLKQAAARAQQDLQLAERESADLQRKAKAAKATSEEFRSEFKRARKSAKQAKKLAAAAEDMVRERCRVLEKARKRLAKALKKLGRGKGKQEGKSAPRRRTPAKQPAIAARTQEPATSGGVTPPPVLPTV